MKLILIILFFVPFLCFGQAQWEWQNPKPIGYNLNDVWFTDSLTGIAVGSAGTVYKTVNGGRIWTKKPISVNYDLTKVHFEDATHGWIVGGNWVTLRTVDGGDTWQLLNHAPTYGALRADICFSTSTIAWSVSDGGSIYKSTNLGATWTSVYYDPGVSLNSIHFSTPMYGFVGSEYSLLRTLDGGATWQQRGTPWVKVNNVHFFGKDSGWAIRQGNQIVKTTNGGNTWDTVFYNGSSLEGLRVLNRREAYAWSKWGHIFKTFDGGRTWLDKDIGSYGIAGVFLNDDRRATAVGANGLIFTSLDSGSNWSQKSGFTIIEGTQWNAVHFASKNVGFAVGSNPSAIAKTSDGEKIGILKEVP